MISVSRKGLTFRWYIARILLAFSAVIAMLIGFLHYSARQDNLRNAALADSKKYIEFIAQKVQRIVLKPGDTELSFSSEAWQNRELTAFLSSIKNLRTFELIDARGIIAFSTEPSSIGSRDEFPRLEVISSGIQRMWTLWSYRSPEDRVGRYLGKLDAWEPGKPSFEYFMPLVSSGKYFGALRISLDLSGYKRRLLSVFMEDCLLVIFLVMLSYVAVVIWSRTAIGKPIDRLLKVQEKIGKGEFEAVTALEEASMQPLGSISTSVEHMARELKKSRDELESKTRSLEKLSEKYHLLARSLEQEVDEKTRELREFFSLVTHDLKIPLAAIGGYADLLLRARTGELNSKQKKFVQAIIAADIHLLALVKNMQDSVKYDTGRMSFDMESFDLNELIEEVCGHLVLLFEQNGIEFVQEMPSSKIMVWGDRTKISQVFHNLLSNAANVTPEKGRVGILVKESPSDVEISITDTGPGIPPDQIRHIFDRYAQLATEKGSSGLGLGLYIVKRILEGHNREIRVRSVPGEGSSFVFNLGRAEAGGAS